MPDFLQLFPPQDPDLLRIVAGFWHLDLQGENPHAWAEQISAAMRDPAARAEVLDALPPQALAAFQDLVSRHGLRPWPEFAREYGEIREMGAGKRDRERPHENPASISELLHYRGLIGRIFLPEGGVLREFVCVPAELLPEGEKEGETSSIPLGKPAAPGMHAFAQPASDRILDHATVLLAALRSGIPVSTLADRPWASDIPFLQALLTAAGILNPDASPRPEKTRAFLAAPRAEALSLLIKILARFSRHRRMEIPARYHPFRHLGRRSPARPPQDPGPVRRPAPQHLVGPGVLPRRGALPSAGYPARGRGLRPLVSSAMNRVPNSGASIPGCRWKAACCAFSLRS